MDPNRLKQTALVMISLALAMPSVAAGQPSHGKGGAAGHGRQQTPYLVVVDLSKNPTTQVLELAGSHQVTFIGMNPLRTKISAGTRNVTVTQAPKPTFLQSAGAPAAPAPGGAAPASPPPVPEQCGTLAAPEALDLWYRYLSKAQNAVDLIIASLDQPKPGETDDARVARFASLGTQIQGGGNTLPNPDYANAQTCLNNLSKAKGGSTADQAAIQALTSPTSPFFFMLAPGSPIPSGNFLLALDPFTCGFLMGGSSSTTQAVTWGPLTTTTGSDALTTVNITQKCLGRVAVSAGVSLNWAAQQTFAAVPTPNGATASTVTTVQYATHSSFQVVPTAFVHVAPLQGCEANVNCFWITFGVGVTSLGGSTANNVNYLFGGSWSFLRYAYLTGGVTTAQQTSLAAGYTIGPPGTQVPAGSSIPTVTNGVFRPFVAVTFGSR